MSIKNVLVTGANRGIGLELVRQLIALPSTKHVIATCRYPQKARDLQKLSNSSSKLNIMELNILNYIQHTKLMDDVHKVVRDSGLNVLINNAGIAYSDSFFSFTFKHMMDNFETNTVAPLMLTRQLLPLLRLSADKKDTSAVINITSLMGSMKGKITNGFQWYPYRASKAALNITSKCLATDLKETGIKVVAVHPGWVKTDMGGHNATVETNNSVNGIINVLQNLSDEFNGKIVTFDGKIVTFDGKIVE